MSEYLFNKCLAGLELHDFNFHFGPAAVTLTTYSVWGPSCSLHPCRLQFIKVTNRENIQFRALNILP